MELEIRQDHILDSIVREAIGRVALGNISRQVFWGAEEDDASEHLRWHVGREIGKITYVFGETIALVGYCHTVQGIRKKYDPLHMMTPRAVERYKAAKRKQEKKEGKAYQKAHAKWEKSVANLPHDDISRAVTIPINVQTIDVQGQECGVLVDSSKDREWRTACFERVVIQYVHLDAIMNIKRYQQTTDLTGETMLRAMEQVRSRYEVETGYLNGITRHDWHYSEGLIGERPTDCGPLAREKQNNVFQRTFEGSATVDEVVNGIKDVYAAGVDFRKGIYRLRDENATRLAEEAMIKEAATNAMVAKF